MNATEMAKVMMDWHPEDDREIIRLCARHFRDEDPAEIYRAVQIVAFEKA